MIVNRSECSCVHPCGHPYSLGTFALRVRFAGLVSASVSVFAFAAVFALAAVFFTGLSAAASGFVFGLGSGLFCFSGFHPPFWRPWPWWCGSFYRLVGVLDGGLFGGLFAGLSALSSAALRVRFVGTSKYKVLMGGRVTVMLCSKPCCGFLWVRTGLLCTVPEPPKAASSLFRISL